MSTLLRFKKYSHVKDRQWSLFVWTMEYDYKPLARHSHSDKEENRKREGEREHHYAILVYRFGANFEAAVIPL